MSGGIGPTAKDFAIPSEGSDDTVAIPEHHPHHRFLSLRQLNALAVSIVFAASGMVAAGDIIIVLFFLPYIIFLSRFAFPPLRPSQSVEPPVFGAGNRLLAVYVAFGALLGLLLPIVYIFEGIMEGDKEGIKAAAPHVFLLASQVFMEGVTFSHHFSLPIRAFVPISYNSLRMFMLIEWVMAEFEKEAIAGGEQWSAMRLVAGKCLAVANLVFWAFNLFGFLLPVYLPRALKRHYGDKEK